MNALLTGLFTGLALIVAIGAQNAYVLRQGVRRDRVALVVAICALSDLALIAAGTAGVGAIITTNPWVPTVFRWAGAAYLLWFAFTSFRAAFTPEALTTGGEHSPGRNVLLTTLALTWLNPHVYLDTLVLLGSLAARWGDLKWWFALGAMSASILWFTALGFGARLLAKPLAKPSVWRWLDIAIGVLMVVFAINLMLG